MKKKVYLERNKFKIIQSHQEVLDILQERKSLKIDKPTHLEILEFKSHQLINNYHKIEAIRICKPYYNNNHHHNNKQVQNLKKSIEYREDN